MPTNYLWIYTKDVARDIMKGKHKTPKEKPKFVKRKKIVSFKGMGFYKPKKPKSLRDMW